MLRAFGQFEFPFNSVSQPFVDDWLALIYKHLNGHIQFKFIQPSSNNETDI